MDHEYGGDIEVSAKVQWRNESGQFMSALDTASSAAVKEAIGEGTRLAVALAPKRKLALAASIQPFMNGPMQGGWVAGSGHAMPQEHGSRPHEIGEPGQILANKEQNFGPVKGPVHHPGNPATHFMRDSYRLVAQTLVKKIKRRLPG